ncbi:hypothetical protein [Bacillus cereus]|uniref:hypothetical protein n=1 Tax=Bacillus cereus TaxID=1396 RepID=UPI00397FE929
MSNPTQPRIGIRKNFMRESQAAELENNDKIVILDQKADNGIETIDLILEPDKLEQLSSKCRLTFEEYCDVINTLIEEEESEWDDLRMKDQINITRDALLQATILKYAKNEYAIDKDYYNGRDFNYIKRYDKQGGFLGEAMVLSLTAIQMMNMKVNY